MSPRPETALDDDRHEVERTVRSVGPWVRTALRETMGLRLAGEDGRQDAHVRVRVADGEGAAWARSVWNALGTKGQAALQAGRAVDEARLAVRHATRGMRDERERIRWTDAEGVLRELEAEREKAQAKLRQAVQGLKELRGDTDDPFGAYAPGQPGTPRANGKRTGATPGEVTIWWFPIAVLARATQTPIRTFALSTLAHELAHAYSNMGRDGDGRGWAASGRWGGLDNDEVEGIAEAWTDVLMLRYDREHTGTWAEHARASLAWQWGPYRHHLDEGWLELDNEGLRAALHEVRRGVWKTMEEAIEKLRDGRKHRRDTGEVETWKKRAKTGTEQP